MVCRNEVEVINDFGMISYLGMKFLEIFKIYIFSFMTLYRGIFIGSNMLADKVQYDKS